MGVKRGINSWMVINFLRSIYLMTRSQHLPHQQVKKPMVSCSNNPDKPIIKQEIDWTYFLEPVDESSRLALIISLIVER